MLTKSRPILLAGFIVAGICVAVYVAPPRDTDYVSSTTRRNGAASVQTRGVTFRDASNGDTYRRAIAADGMGDFVGAEKMFREIIERTPDELAAWHGLGTSLYFQHRDQESREAYEHILRIDPHHEPARCGLGAVERAMKRYPEAVKQYSLAIEENARSSVAYYGRGVSYFELGKRAEALADLKKVIELLPPDAAIAGKAKQYIQRLTDDQRDPSPAT